MYKRNSAGKMQFVIDQDRETVYPLDVGNLMTFPAIANETIYGINVMYIFEETPFLLGTFDSVEEAIEAINKIIASDDEFIAIDGFTENVYEDAGSWLDSFDDMFEDADEFGGEYDV